MNALTQLLRRLPGPLPALAAAGMFAWLNLAPVAAAYADPPVIALAATRSAKVSLAGLDLSTPAGARIAYERIRRMAESLCDDRDDSWSRYHAATYNTCVRETVAEAVHQIQAPALAALNE